jgi:chromate transporter
LTHAGRWFKVVAMSDNPAPEPSRLAEVARLFLKLGFTAFGGPAAHVALMEAEVVTRRKWLDRQHFLDILSAVNFVPGPNSTELAIHLGLVRAGWRGLIVAGVCFIVPAMLIIFPLAWCYVTYGATPGVGEALTAVKACMVAIIAMAMWRFARTGIKDAFTALVAGTAVVVSVLLQYFRVPQQELIILAAAAVAGFFWYGRTLRSASPAEVQPAAQRSGKALRSLPLVALPLSAGAGFSGQLLAMALFFLKVGATLFGSGYVLASFLHSGLVEQHKWLSEQQLLDAIAVGQITPGPLLTTATFIGFVLGSQ